MREQIQAYVNGLFADAALTIRNAEVRQEILQHTLDRYDDLVASGKPEQEAYDEAVAGIGDVSELYEHKPAEKQAEAPTSARDFITFFFIYEKKTQTNPIVFLTSFYYTTS